MKAFPELENNIDWANISDSYKKMQQISGLVAISGILMSIFILFTASVPRENLINVWITILLASVFTAIYYLFPVIYENRKLEFLPDLVFVMGIFSIMINLREQGQFYFIFLLLIISINAFFMSNKLYLLSFLEIMLAIILVHFIEGHISLSHINRDVLFQLYGVIAFFILSRIFSNETLSLRKKQEDLSLKLKEQLLQKKEIYLLIDNITDGIIAVDTEKKIKLINKSALKILGIFGSVNKLIGKNIDQIMPVASTEGRISIVDKTLLEKESVKRDDFKLVRTDKTSRIQVNINPVINSDKSLSGAIVLFRDITAEMEVEKQREEFNAIASHELRTPLTVIEGFLFNVLSDKNLKYDKKTKEYIEQAYDSAQSLIHLSNDVLSVVKAENNQLKINLEKFDMTKLAKEAIKNCQSHNLNKKLKFNLDFENGLPDINSDPQKIKEIITNLIENAIKFTDKGAITVSGKMNGQNEIEISVTDTGIGIAKKDQKMIFHKFYRTEDWQTRKTGGTGLGLYISKNYIDRLGGKISVESLKGKGSRFYFTLPVEPRKRRKKQTEAQLNDFIQSI